jgi:hypothetical protein
VTNDKRAKKTKTAAKAAPVAAAAAVKQEETLTPTGPLPNILSLVVPPFSLSKSLMERIRENYIIYEAATLNVAEIQSSAISKNRSARPLLVVLSSLDDITE